ncbi:hypothetical protein GCM10018793_38540 [Streptomyces sulfonofaciens]|uniref:Uncharacterized protein n=1 Tax=Streptomyces sulfonofaciens TaxID=68272 RepID=A0A919GBA5_9ACTN|nr:hypothetical protein [Streptomyces sulfonofaciens]GHH81365.1 hypothetical protein GCM10018793_38540 [Streptomyces sulfonofaciens]
MSGTAGGRRVWVVGGLCGSAAVGLLAVSVLVDLDTGDRVASVVGAVVGLAGLAVSVWTAVRDGQPGPGAPSGGGTRRTVRARGRGAVAAGGDVSGNAVGDRSRVTRTAAPASPPGGGRTPPPGRSEVAARGPGAVAAGGEASGNAVGSGSEVEER